MSWAEVKKINSDLGLPLNSLVSSKANLPIRIYSYNGSNQYSLNVNNKVRVHSIFIGARNGASMYVKLDDTVIVNYASSSNYWLSVEIGEFLALQAADTSYFRLGLPLYDGDNLRLSFTINTKFDGILPITSKTKSNDTETVGVLYGCPIVCDKLEVVLNTTSGQGNVSVFYELLD